MKPNVDLSIFNKDILYKKYIEENLSLNELCVFFNCPYNTLRGQLDKYKIKKNTSLQKINREKKLLEKYGVINVSQLQEVKEKKKNNPNIFSKEAIKKGIETKIKIYGCACNCQKIRQTKLEKYGDATYNNREKFSQTYCDKSEEEKKAIVEKAIKTRKSNNKPISQESIKKRQEAEKIRFGGCLRQQLHLPKETLKIISTRENLLEWIKKQPIKDGLHLSQKLGIKSPTTFLQYIKKYDLYRYLDHMFGGMQKELWLHITDMGIKTQMNKRILKKYEIDIFCPDYNIGIEFNGNYWHSEDKVEKNYHINKTKAYQEKGIRIIHIFEYEWLEKPLKIIAFLKDIFKKNIKKVYARNCIVKEIDTFEKNLFLNENHLQGEDKSKIKYGLFFNEELLAVMTWCKPRFNQKYDWELSRFAVKSGYCVIGGASKLFKYKPEGKLISYQDIAKFNGNLYEKLGFKLSHISSPNYVWCNRDKVLTRYKCQMKNEVEIMRDKGYLRVYDCGNKVWEYF